MSAINNLIIFSLFAGLFIYLLAPCQFNNTCLNTPTQNTPIVQILVGAQNSGVGGVFANLIGQIQAFFNNPVNIIGATAALAIGITFYPNPWLIFLVPAIYISGWLVWPVSIFNASNIGITDPNGAMQVGLFFTCMQVAVLVLLNLAFISWFKGQETIGG